MNMTREEMLKSYKEAKDKKNQITILADMNLCTKQEIKDELIKAGVPEAELPRFRTKKTQEPVKITVLDPQDKPIMPKVVREVCTAKMVEIQERIDADQSELKEIKDFMDQYN